MKISTKPVEETARLDVSTPEQKARASMILEMYRSFKNLPAAVQFEVIEKFQNEYPEVARVFTDIMRESVEDNIKIKKWRKRRRQ